MEAKDPARADFSVQANAFAAEVLAPPARSLRSFAEQTSRSPYKATHRVTDRPRKEDPATGLPRAGSRCSICCSPELLVDELIKGFVHINVRLDYASLLECDTGRQNGFALA